MVTANVAIEEARLPFPEITAAVPFAALWLETLGRWVLYHVVDGGEDGTRTRLNVGPVWQVVRRNPAYRLRRVSPYLAVQHRPVPPVQDDVVHDEADAQSNRLWRECRIRGTLYQSDLRSVPQRH